MRCPNHPGNEQRDEGRTEVGGGLETELIPTTTDLRDNQTDHNHAEMNRQQTKAGREDENKFQGIT